MEVFTVSVIIPVYNAERFIEKAILSVVEQPEVHELLVVNDGSTDGSASLIKKLQKTHPRINLLHHENNINKGRSASRNLGISKASGNYIAFLDADDYYLPNRFTTDKELFQLDSKIDGVYNAIGAHFYRTVNTKEQESLSLYTVRGPVEYHHLFKALLTGSHGHFSIIGLTVKRRVFETVGYFQEHLVVSEDTELIWKMALKCRLEGGVLDRPLAIRGVHETNSFNQTDLYIANRIDMFKSLVIWSSKNQVAFTHIDALLKWLWLLKYKQKASLWQYITYWGKLVFKAPYLLTSVLWIKYFPLVRLRKEIFRFLYK